MKDHTGCVRQFTHLSRAWYGEANLRYSEHTDAVTFGLYSEDGSTTGEMELQWVEINHDKYVKFVIYDDAFHALSTFDDVVQALAAFDDTVPPPETICTILLACGFVDVTPTQPHFQAGGAQ